MPRVSQYNQRISNCEEKLKRLDPLFAILDASRAAWNISLLFIYKFMRVMCVICMISLTLLIILFYPSIKFWINDVYVTRFYIEPWVNKHNDDWSDNRQEQTTHFFYDYVLATEAYNYYYDMHSKCIQGTLSHNTTNKFKNKINQYYGSDQYYNHYHTMYNHNVTALNDTFWCKLNDINEYLDFRQYCNMNRKRLKNNMNKRFRDFEDKKQRTFQYLVCGEYQSQYEKYVEERNAIYQNYSVLRQEMCEEKRVIERKLSLIALDKFQHRYSTLRYPCVNFMHCGTEDDEMMHKIWMECYEAKHAKTARREIALDFTKFVSEFKGI